MIMLNNYRLMKQPWNSALVIMMLWIMMAIHREQWFININAVNHDNQWVWLAKMGKCYFIRWEHQGSNGGNQCKFKVMEKNDPLISTKAVLNLWKMLVWQPRLDQYDQWSMALSSGDLSPQANCSGSIPREVARKKRPIDPHDLDLSKWVQK